MSQTSPTPNQRLVTELKVSAHLMLLDPGTFCIFHSPGTQPPDPATGLPGVRITRPPATPPDAMSISTFSPDGWLGGDSGAALVKVIGAPSQVLVTVYQAAGTQHEAPKLQVLRLSEQSAAPAQTVQNQTATTQIAATRDAGQTPAADTSAPAETEKPEVAAHVQRRGDLLTRLGEWMGERGSQNWIEGFAVQPSRHVEPTDIEYQAVLGKGWLSPWAEGGKYCGSRGMALPILGLRVRLKGEAAARCDVRVSATFTDGTAVGPVDGSQTAEAESLAPLEAFLIELLPRADVAEAEAAPAASKPPSKPVAKAPVVVKPAPKSPLSTPVRVATPRVPTRVATPGTHPGAKTGAKSGKPSGRR